METLVRQLMADAMELEIAPLTPGEVRCPNWQILPQC